jgi:tellurite resistance protein
MSDHLFRAGRRWNRPTRGLKFFDFPDEAVFQTLRRVPGASVERGAVMPKRYTNPHAALAALTTNYPDYPDEEVLQALVTAGALVALADGSVAHIERDDLVNYIDRQEFVPAFPPHEIAAAFDERVQELKDRDTAEVIISTFRPLAGLSMASVVVRAAERVAAADRQIHPGELQALKLIRLVLSALPERGGTVRKIPEQMRWTLN